jgi:carboxymethylenebutenolidase
MIRSTLRSKWLALCASLLVAPIAAAQVPETVYFPSLDGTQLVGYVFAPDTPGPHPAVVMLHGRAGPYSSNVNSDCTFVGEGVDSPCNAGTLSKRHMQWGLLWASRGYVAVHVDSFGPRGVAHGFGPNTHDDPEREPVNERTVRPLDAHGALAWLRMRGDVIADRIGLQGWSNGGSTTLNVMGVDNPALADPTPETGFRAAIAFYPGCGTSSLYHTPYSSYARMKVFLAGADAEVSPVICQHVLDRAYDLGSDVEYFVYDGAVHGFDDPSPSRQGDPANRAATEDSMQRAMDFFEEELEGGDLLPVDDGGWPE